MEANMVRRVGIRDFANGNDELFLDGAGAALQLGAGGWIGAKFDVAGPVYVAVLEGTQIVPQTAFEAKVAMLDVAGNPIGATVVQQLTSVFPGFVRVLVEVDPLVSQRIQIQFRLAGNAAAPAGFYEGIALLEAN
jgi:hypothetical protein